MLDNLPPYIYYELLIRMISTIQCLVFTMVILTLDAILSSRTSIATSSPWFGTAYGGYSHRNTMVMVLQMADDSFATDYECYEINSVNKVNKKLTKSKFS